MVAPGRHRPREKDWCLDKDWFQELWASESLSATPNILSAQGVHTAPITQLRTILPVFCPLRGLPSYDPLTATVGIQTPGMEPGASPGQGSQPPCGPTCRHPQVPTAVHLWVLYFNPQSLSFWVGAQPSGSWTPRIMGDLPLGAGIWSPGRVCHCGCVPAWGCSSVATHVLQLSQPNSLTQ